MQSSSLTSWPSPGLGAAPMVHGPSTGYWKVVTVSRRRKEGQVQKQTSGVEELGNTITHVACSKHGFLVIKHVSSVLTSLARLHAIFIFPALPGLVVIIPVDHGCVTFRAFPEVSPGGCDSEMGIQFGHAFPLKFVRNLRRKW